MIDTLDSEKGVNLKLFLGVIQLLGEFEQSLFDSIEVLDPRGQNLVQKPEAIVEQNRQAFDDRLPEFALFLDVRNDPLDKNAELDGGLDQLEGVVLDLVQPLLDRVQVRFKENVEILQKFFEPVRVLLLGEDLEVQVPLLHLIGRAHHFEVFVDDLLLDFFQFFEVFGQLRLGGSIWLKRDVLYSELLIFLITNTIFCCIPANCWNK